MDKIWLAGKLCFLSLHSRNSGLCSSWVGGRVGGGMDHGLCDPCPSFLNSLPFLPPTLPTTTRNSRK